MEVKLKEENQLLTFLKALFGSSEQGKTDLEKEIEKIRDNEDKEHILDLLNVVVKSPTVKKARFNDKNIKAKVSSRNIRIKEQQEEKTMDEDKIQEI